MVPVCLLMVDPTGVPLSPIKLRQDTKMMCVVPRQDFSSTNPRGGSSSQTDKTMTMPVPVLLFMSNILRTAHDLETRDLSK